jgi:ATP-binding cassette, subfamily C, bacterial LapB
VLFLAKSHGNPAERATLIAGVPLVDGRLPQAEVEACCARAGLSLTALDPARIRPTMLPALVLGDNGRALVVLKRDGTRFECHVPGVAGVSWFEPDAIAVECPGARWFAVRPALFFDQRSLLYALPQVKTWFWDVFGRNRWIFKWSLLGALALNIFGALIPFYSMAVYDRVLPNNALDSLWVLSGAAVLLVMFELAMRVLRGYLVESAARRMDVALSSAIFSHCLKLRAASRPASGGVLANTVRDFESVREFFASSTLTALGDVPFMLIFLILIALIGHWLVLVPLTLIPIIFGIAWMMQKPLARAVSSSARESAQRTAHLFETMNGLDTVKSLGAEAWSRNKWEKLTVAIARNTLHTRELVAHASHASATLLALNNILIVLIGAILIGEQSLSMGQLIGVTMLASRALQPAVQLSALFVRWQQTKVAMNAIDQVMSAPVDEVAASISAPPLEGHIEFRDVTFGYPKSPPLLNGFNLVIGRGERVGFIGRLGSGKSTLLKLLLNLYAPQAGNVLVDQMLASQIEPLSLRRQLGYVPQDVTLFHGTVRENIELGRMRGDAALVDAIRAACLDEVLTQLPAGLSTQVGERGENLSGGQRQTVAIARALLCAPPILLLDEPSSMIDPATEQRLIGRLRALDNCTLLLVTHRMAMLPLVDRLVVVDRGRIVIDGPRDDVLRTLAQKGPPVRADAKPPAAAITTATVGRVPATGA